MPADRWHSLTLANKMTVSALSQAYHAFGIGLDSDIELPGTRLRESGTPAVLRIVTGNVIRETDENQQTSGSSFRLAWPGTGAFEITPGLIQVFPVAGCKLDIIRLPLLGSVLACALHQLGRFVMHGNSVEVGGRASVFIGAKGKGKSTITSALLNRGHRLISDDLVVLDRLKDETIHALPGFPFVKLWPDSLTRFSNIPIVESHRLVPDYEKLSLKIAASQTASRAVPIQAVYVLDEASETSAYRLSNAEALKETVTHTYCSRYGGTLLSGRTAIHHFQFCSQLLSAIPVIRLSRTQDLSSLDKMVAAVEKIAETRAVAA